MKIPIIPQFITKALLEKESINHLPIKNCIHAGQECTDDATILYFKVTILLMLDVKFIKIGIISNNPDPHAASELITKFFNGPLYGME